MEIGFKTDTGKVRNVNQDAFFVMPKERFFLVADGVGGHNNGELASRTVMSDIAEFVKGAPLSADADDTSVKDYLKSLIGSANAHVYKMARQNTPGGMATTLVALYIGEKKAYVANVGDSRLYLVRDGSIRQITEDHTYVNKLIKEGIITKEQARTHPDKNMITRAIGAEAEVKPDYFDFEIRKNDILVLCTDGLYNEIKDQELCEALVSAKDMRTVCSSLVEQANDRGGADNITVVSVKL